MVEGVDVAAQCLLGPGAFVFGAEFGVYLIEALFDGFKGVCEFFFVARGGGLRRGAGRKIRGDGERLEIETEEGDGDDGGDGFEPELATA